MPIESGFLLFIGPAALALGALVGFLQPGRRPGAALAAARGATLIAFAAALFGAVAVATGAGGPDPAFALLRWDALSATMAVLVTFLGAIIVHFSRAYLDGDERHGAFLGGLCLTLACVLTLVTSNDLRILAAAWVATSLALHNLLLFYRDRPAARIAARKKFVAARIGDVCLIAGAILLTRAFGTPDIGHIAQAAKDAIAFGAFPVEAQMAAGFLVVAAIIKSAQFPFHGWLPEVMETPTPVSALLHAGIINAGGFLIIRFGDVMLGSTAALAGLAIVGAISALIGCLAMRGQTSVKVSLAYSTLGQMGFMLLQCGLGAFSAAAVHIVAHALYKAHAFLSAGSAVETAMVSRSVAKTPLTSTAAIGAIALALAAFAVVATAVSTVWPLKPAIVGLGAIFVMGLSVLVAEGLRADAPGAMLPRALGAATAASVLYFALQIGAETWLAGAVPAAAATLSPMHTAILALTLIGFAVAVRGQLLGAGSFTRALNVHLANGLYANAVFNRLVRAQRTQA